MKTYPLINQIVDNSAHLLIGGTTGSGKSVLLASIIYSLAYRNAIFVLIDPKRVELSRFRGLENTTYYANNSADAEHLLERVCETMDNRYERMERQGIYKSSECPIYVVIDEIADLMLSANKKAIETLLQRISQLGRASNIKLILASQIIRADILTNKVTANIDGRIALRCRTPLESRMLIGVAGAENLPKYGYAYVSDSCGLRSISVPMTGDDEIRQITRFKPHTESTKEGKTSLLYYINKIKAFF